MMGKSWEGLVFVAVAAAMAFTPLIAVNAEED